jgi:hypothetical protein
MGSFCSVGKVCCINVLRQVLQKFCIIMQRSWFGKRAVGPVAFTNAKPQLTLGASTSTANNASPMKKPR